jgi:hypothetical protein
MALMFAVSAILAFFSHTKGFVREPASYITSLPRESLRVAFWIKEETTLP